MAEFRGTVAGEGRRVGVIASRFNEEVTVKLLEGAVECLVRHGVRFEDVDVVWVPGAWGFQPPPNGCSPRSGTTRSWWLVP